MKKPDMNPDASVTPLKPCAIGGRRCMAALRDGKPLPCGSGAPHCMLGWAPAGSSFRLVASDGQLDQHTSRVLYASGPNGPLEGIDPAAYWAAHRIRGLAVDLAPLNLFPVPTRLVLNMFSSRKGGR